MTTLSENIAAERSGAWAERIAYLREFVLPERYEGFLSRLEHRTRYMVVGLEDIFYPHNASAVIRSAEAFGIQEIHAVEQLTRFAPSKNVVRGTDRWVDIRKWKCTRSLVDHLRGERGYRIVVTSPHEGGVTPSEFDLQSGPFALFLGTEKTGISQWLMEQADGYITVPMVGFAESLNISVSAAIVTQRLTERLRNSAEGIAWQLQPEDRLQLLYTWLCGSIRDVEGILTRGGFSQL